MKTQKTKTLKITSDYEFDLDDNQLRSISEYLQDKGFKSIQFLKSIKYGTNECNCLLRELAGIVAKGFGITVDDIVSKSRLSSKVFARHAFHQLARETLLFPLQKVGDFTLRNHATVLHSCEAVQGLIESKNLLFMRGYDKSTRMLKQKIKDNNIMETYFDFVKQNLDEYLDGEKIIVELAKAERIEIAGGVVFNIVAILDDKPINVVGDNAELTMKQLLKSIEDITIGVGV